MTKEQALKAIERHVFDCSVGIIPESIMWVRIETVQMQRRDAMHIEDLRALSDKKEDELAGWLGRVCG